MDQNIPMSSGSPSKFLRVLYQMWESDGDWDLFYLSGFAETLRLIELENAREPGKHDLQIDSIASVVRAWGDFERDDWNGGFVVELRDGRRVYLESYADGDEWGPDSYASVMPMLADEDLPKLPSNHVSKPFGWRKGLPELDEYLRRAIVS
jgi:hypothetical protein